MSDELAARIVALLESIEATLKGGKPWTCQPPADRETSDGYVYVVRCSPCGLIKIGFSHAPGDRLGGLHCPRACQWDLDMLAARPGDRDAERLLHRRYAEFRFLEPRRAERGRWTDGQREWFSLDESDLVDLLGLVAP